MSRNIIVKIKVVLLLILSIVFQALVAFVEGLSAEGVLPDALPDLGPDVMDVGTQTLPDDLEFPTCKYANLMNYVHIVSLIVR